jgi:hypothetical protein
MGKIEFSLTNFVVYGTAITLAPQWSLLLIHPECKILNLSHRGKANDNV